MDIITGTGGFSDREIVSVRPREVELFEDRILTLLKRQPASYESFFSAEEIIQAIKHGILNCWLYQKAGEDRGLLIFSYQIYSASVRTVKIEFFSCQYAYEMKALIHLLEDLARKNDFTYIEAVAHPTLASYAVEKMGYSAPAVYVRKPLQFNRRN